MIALIALVSFVSLSRAETPVTTTAPAPVPFSIIFQTVATPTASTVGTTPVSPETPVMGSGSNISGCSNLVSSASSTKKTGDLAIKLAAAETACLAEKNREEELRQDKEAKRVAELAGAYFVVNGATPAAISGKSTSYINGKVKIATGSAGEWQAYGDAVKKDCEDSDGNPIPNCNNGLNGVGGLNGTIDSRYSNLYVMDQVRANMMGHPAMPNMPNMTPSTPATITNDGANEIAKLKEQVEELKRANALNAIDGS